MICRLSLDVQSVSRLNRKYVTGNRPVGDACERKIPHDETVMPPHPFFECTIPPMIGQSVDSRSARAGDDGLRVVQQDAAQQVVNPSRLQLCIPQQSKLSRRSWDTYNKEALDHISMLTLAASAHLRPVRWRSTQELRQTQANFRHIASVVSSSMMSLKLSLRFAFACVPHQTKKKRKKKCEVGHAMDEQLPRTGHARFVA
ncbi:uncharacterized protein J3D65DRAFT_142034 [Phyllosticta citribraziliensis]|uniref:Uncharacterized protein n=1 Tax=Phyllosticta citribraziliensis TaxID=989973 RepID=A0ABR1L6R0_9PEZI